MTVGGWFDAEDLYGPLAAWRAVERNNPGILNTLVMGPWPHGGWSRRRGRPPRQRQLRRQNRRILSRTIELPFLKHFLKDDPKFDLPKALVFETGTNQWRATILAAEKFRRTSIYLHAGGRLSFDPPAAGEVV